MSGDFNAINVTQKTGNEYFIDRGKPTEKKLTGFWQWAFSDLTNNAMRGVLAEYIIACELGIETGTRLEWDAYDLITKSGIKLEIKSASYLQSWKQAKLSDISFNISPTKGWNASTNEYGNEIKRQADVYIFCILKHQNKSTLDPMDFDQWAFYLLPTAILNEKMPTQKTVRLSSLLKLNPLQAAHGEICMAIEKIFSVSVN